MNRTNKPFILLTPMASRRFDAAEFERSQRPLGITGSNAVPLKLPGEH